MWWGNIRRAWLLNVDQDCIEGGVEPKLCDELEHIAVRVTGPITSRKGEKLIQGSPSSIAIPLGLRLSGHVIEHGTLHATAALSVLKGINRATDRFRFDYFFFIEYPRKREAGLQILGSS